MKKREKQKEKRKKRKEKRKERRQKGANDKLEKNFTLNFPLILFIEWQKKINE